jgi:hypothetical protein
MDTLPLQPILLLMNAKSMDMELTMAFHPSAKIQLKISHNLSKVDLCIVHLWN